MQIKDMQPGDSGWASVFALCGDYGAKQLYLEGSAYLSNCPDHDARIRVQATTRGMAIDLSHCRGIEDGPLLPPKAGAIECFDLTPGAYSRVEVRGQAPAEPVTLSLAAGTLAPAAEPETLTGPQTSSAAPDSEK